MLSCPKHTVEEDSRNPATFRICRLCIRIYVWGREPWVSLPLLPWPWVQALSSPADEWVAAFGTQISLLLILSWKSLVHGLRCVLFRGLFMLFVICKLIHRFPSLRSLWNQETGNLIINIHPYKKIKHVGLDLGSMLLTDLIGKVPTSEIIFILWSLNHQKKDIK